MEDIFNRSEQRYKEMPDFQDLDYYVNHNDNIQAIENLLDSDYRELYLEPYYEPKKVKVYVESEGCYIKYADEVIEHKINTYGFIERSDFGSDEVIFIY